MGGESVAAGEAILNQRRHSHLRLSRHRRPDVHADVAVALQPPGPLRDARSSPPAARTPPPPARSPAPIIEAARAEGRTLLTEFESKQHPRGLRHPDRARPASPRPRTRPSPRPKPSAIRSCSSSTRETITHKTDVGGVQLNLADADAVRAAFRSIEESVARAAPAPGTSTASRCSRWSKLDGYELIVGSSLDPQFGPVLLFGTGGQLVEVFRDRALALPPLNTTLARRMMEQTRILTALKGVRGRPPVDLAALEQLLVRFSRPGGRAALDQGDRHQPAAGLARAAAGARRARHRPRAGGPRVRAAAPRDPPLPEPLRHVLDGQRRHGAAPPADPPRGRAAAGGLPRHALGANASRSATSTR